MVVQISHQKSEPKARKGRNISKNRECFDVSAFDGAFVGATANAEVAVFAPSFAPTILHDPELLAGFLLDSVADHQHGVTRLFEGIKLPQIFRQKGATSGSIASPNTAGIIKERLGDLKVGANDYIIGLDNK